MTQTRAHPGIKHEMGLHVTLVVHMADVAIAEDQCPVIFFCQSGRILKDLSIHSQPPLCRRSFSNLLIVTVIALVLIVSVLVRCAPKRRERDRVPLLLSSLWRRATTSIRRVISRILTNQQREISSAICQLQRSSGRLFAHFTTLGTSPCPTSHLLQSGHQSLH